MQRKYRGTALISALFVTVIAALIASALMTNQQLLIQQSQWLTRADQMTLDLQLVSYWAMSQIQKQVSVAHYIPLETHLNDRVIHQVIVRGILEDAQAKFNLNDLKNEDKQAGFAKMIHFVDSQLSLEQSMLIAEQMGKWLNQHKMVSINDLKEIPEMSASLIAAIKPYVTVLPEQVPINVNTAAIPVLLSANLPLTVTQAETIVECRQAAGGFFTAENFEASCVTLQHFPSFSSITTHSKYYETFGEAITVDNKMTSHHLLMVQSNNTKNSVGIIW